MRTLTWDEPYHILGAIDEDVHLVKNEPLVSFTFGLPRKRLRDLGGVLQGHGSNIKHLKGA